ncbi:MAG: serine hydrolase domain-containing protein [Nevskia sp.]
MKLTSTLDACLKRGTDGGNIPGIVALVADRSGVIYEGASGVRAHGGSVPMTLDTFAWFASMTKAVTGAAAMQLVEQGRLDLDAPAAKVLPELAKVQVRSGWDAAGKAILRAPKGAITLRNLLTHTSGFAYEIFRADVDKELNDAGKPNVISGSAATMDRALVADPGSEWNYGIGIDWAGRMVEQVSGLRLRDYMARHLFAPLAMKDVGFAPSAEQQARASAMHARLPDGSLLVIPFGIPPDAEFDMGGHALQGSLPDYLRFTRAILGGGVLDGNRVLEAKTVATMSQNHIGALSVPPIKTHLAQLSNDCDFFPGIDCKWGLSFMINMQDIPGGRRAGSLAWAGLPNAYFWIDPAAGIAAVILTQILPFFDARVVTTLREFESAIYAAR